MTVGQGRPKSWKTKYIKYNWGCWNVRSLNSQLTLTDNGEIKIEGKEPQKIDELCAELQKHNLSLCAVSEHRWRDKGTYRVNDHWTFLYSGLDKSSEIRASQGVGILLNQDMLSAWRRAGELCEYRSARLLRIRLFIRNRYVSVVSCYAPTYTHAEVEKERFYTELGQVLDQIPSRDELVILGDFNARVGTNAQEQFTHGDTGIRAPVGRFGLPEVNDNGVRLLDFLATRDKDGLRVLSTCFRHSTYGTWFHPSSRKWFQLDHVICSARTAGLVTDVKVMPGYVHNTDHRCLKVQIRFPPKKALGKHFARRDNPRPSRIPRLQVQLLQDEEVRARFLESFFNIGAEGLVNDSYELFSHALRRVGWQILGPKEARFEPEWKAVNQERLQELSAYKRQVAMEQQEGCRSSQYKTACKFVKKETRRLINEWWQQKAAEIQSLVDQKTPQHQFAGFRALRKLFVKGQMPARTLLDAAGTPLLNKDARVQRWREYFSELLNVPTVVGADELACIQCLVPYEPLNAPLDLAETLVARDKLKAGKACGPDGIEAELLLSLNTAGVRLVHEYFCRIWDGVEEMPKEWKESYLVPLPKSGDLSKCSRWRGILLSSIPGKVFARILNARLNAYVEANDILPESQCGFRAGRSTMDMIFCIRMVMEVASLKQVPSFFLFIDLVKAYDCVSRAGLWLILEKKGVPQKFIQVLRSYYTGKEAKVAVEGTLSDAFFLETGLGQGCCLAPLLFNFFLSAVFEAWHKKSSPGLHWYTRIDGILHHREALDKYASWEDLMLEEFGYADDAALVADTLHTLHTKAGQFQSHLNAWGMTLSVDKTEAMATDDQTHDPIELVPQDGKTGVGFTPLFSYLGVQISDTGAGDQAVLDRIDKARKAFWSLNSSVWNVYQLSLGTKIRVFRACVMSVLLYGAEAWTYTYPTRSALNRFYMICLRRIAKVSLYDQHRYGISNEDIRAWLGVPPVEALVRQSRLRWLGHVARMPNHRLPKKMLFAFLDPDEGIPRPPGHLHGKRLRDSYVQDLESIGMSKNSWLQVCSSSRGSEQWRLVTRQVALWYPPRCVQRGGSAPERKPEELPSNVFHGVYKKRPTHQSRLDKAQQLIQTVWIPQSAFLQFEAEVGGRQAWCQKLASRVLELACEANDFEGLLALILEDYPTIVEIDDFVLFQALLFTVCRQASQPPPIPPRTGLTPKRLPRKSAQPAWYQVMADRTSLSKQELIDKPVRVRSAYWNLKGKSRTRDVEGAEFVCDVPGCGKAYPTKQGLSQHKSISHPEGTFREAGFDCPHCPRSFARETALKRHLSYEHGSCPHPFTCPWCHGVWPGKPGLRAHMAVEHAIPDSEFPMTCPHCVDTDKEHKSYHTQHGWTKHYFQAHA